MDCICDVHCSHTPSHLCARMCPHSHSHRRKTAGSDLSEIRTPLHPPSPVLLPSVPSLPPLASQQDSPILNCTPPLFKRPAFIASHARKTASCVCPRGRVHHRTAASCHLQPRKQPTFLHTRTNPQARQPAHQPPTRVYTIPTTNTKVLSGHCFFQPRRDVEAGIARTPDTPHPFCFARGGLSPGVSK
jgi:hypothetical protein